ncbi:hypothetical protein WHZ77_26630 [Bradyrhizobium sp. A5]|uniref:hypothetical protein n=1 Tax=Bradyrhizobium sp. A5 TaxID=3133696 RepID=UPI00324C6E11
MADDKLATSLQSESESGGFSLEAIVFSLYLIRDAFGGVMRYYSAKLHMDVLWFTPDLAAILCIALFLKRCIVDNRSVMALLVFIQICISLGIGFFFLGSTTALFSSIKMMFPLFVGFCFCDASIGSYRRMLQIVTVTFYITLGGVFLSKYWSMPWVGFKYESFGAVREAGRLWWSFAEQRLTGFAADSTMAAYFILIAFVLTSIRRSILWCLVLGGISAYAIRLTTNKTTMGVLIIYVICLLVVRSLPEEKKLLTLRRLTLSSFAAMLIPAVLILLLSGVDLSPGHKGFFFSIQDRINNSWQLPFVYLSQLMPIGIITGCGVGCFNYPQQLFSNLHGYWVPVDNFYIGTYVMFGLPFVVYMWMVFRATSGMTDVYKLSVIFVMNIFTITVLSYGPATGLLVIALGFSEVFSRRMTGVLQGAPRTPNSDGVPLHGVAVGGARPIS